jgi:hypothetical protein
MKLGCKTFVFLLPGLLAAAGCHSYQVETTVENRTGAAIHLAAGETVHSRIQIRGSGVLKVQYTAGDGRTAQIDGPQLAERQEGRLEIVLLPAGKADFRPELTPQP